jgi:hypothetical protein
LQEEEELQYKSKSGRTTENWQALLPQTIAHSWASPTQLTGSSAGLLFESLDVTWMLQWRKDYKNQATFFFASSVASHCAVRKASVERKQRMYRMRSDRFGRWETVREIPFLLHVSPHQLIAAPSI